MLFRSKIWIDDKKAYQNGKHGKRIKMYDHNHKEFAMGFDGTVFPEEIANQCKLSAKELEQIYTFIQNNIHALDYLADKKILYKDIFPYLITGGKPADEDEIQELNIKVDELEKKNIQKDSSNQQYKTIKERYGLYSKANDFFYFYTLSPETTGLPVWIWINEENVYQKAGLKPRIKFRADYDNYQDGEDSGIFEMDLDGNIYSHSDDDFFKLSKSECEEILNWFRNNQYALEQIVNGEVGTWHIEPYFIKGGKPASEEEKEKLKNKCEYLSWKKGNWKKEKERRKAENY